MMRDPAGHRRQTLDPVRDNHSLHHLKPFGQQRLALAGIQERFHCRLHCQLQFLEVSGLVMYFEIEPELTDRSRFDVRICRDEQADDRRPLASSFLEQLHSELPRHPLIRQEDPDGRPLPIKYCARLCHAGRGEDAEFLVHRFPEILKRLFLVIHIHDRVFPIIVACCAHALLPTRIAVGSADSHGAESCDSPRCIRICHLKIERNLSPASFFGGNIDISAVVFDDRMTDRQSRPIPSPTSLVVKNGSRRLEGRPLLRHNHCRER